MKLPAALLIAGILPLLHALQLRARDPSSPELPHLDIQRKHVSNPILRDRLRRRQASGTLQATLDNLETLYFANLSLGTPVQNFRLQIDTGSSDLWVNTPDSSLCQSRKRVCTESGTYSANDSSTYQYKNSVFNISYVDGSGARGDYVTDVLNFAGAQLDGFQFGIGYQSSSAQGVLGIGYPVNEVQVNRGGLDSYPNLPQKLVDDGIIQTPAYSLWLNDLDASTGSILFGGVDTEKYEGSLATLPIVKELGVYSEFIVTLSGMGHNGNTGSIFSGQTLPVLLDSGASLIYLPDNLATSIFQSLGATWESQSQAAVVACDLANQDDTLDFTFNGKTIQVPMNEIVLDLGLVDRNGNAVCLLGIAPTGSVSTASVSVLGDTFLRSAYVVYDLENNQLHIAQTNFNTSKTNIKAITSGQSGVPDTTGVPTTGLLAATGTAGSRSSKGGAALARKTAVPVAAVAAVAAAMIL